MEEFSKCVYILFIILHSLISTPENNSIKKKSTEKKNGKVKVLVTWPFKTICILDYFSDLQQYIQFYRTKMQLWYIALVSSPQPTDKTIHFIQSKMT